MQLQRATLLLIGILAAGYAACVNDDTSATSPDAGAGQKFDASVDGTVGNDAAPGPDAAGTDAGVADASDGAVQTDARVDAADAADAAPQLDDAGCPVPTGVVANAADAGLPEAGIALWLRADLGLATKDGGVVCRWDDVSGNSRAFLPGTATPPVVETAALNGKPSITFTGNTSYLYRNDVLGLPATSGRTFAAYGRSTDTTHRNQYIYQAAPGTPGTYVGVDTNTFLTAGNREGVYAANNAFDSNVATSTTPHSYIFSVASLVVGSPLPAGLVYAIDGTATTLTKTAGTGLVEDFSAANVTWIGTATDPAFTTKTLAEVLVYDHALSPTERTAVAAYFQSRYP